MIIPPSTVGLEAHLLCGRRFPFSRIVLPPQGKMRGVQDGLVIVWRTVRNLICICQWWLLVVRNTYAYHGLWLLTVGLMFTIFHDLRRVHGPLALSMILRCTAAAGWRFGKGQEPNRNRVGSFLPLKDLIEYCEVNGILLSTVGDIGIVLYSCSLLFNIFWHWAPVTKHHPAHEKWTADPGCNQGLEL